MSKSFSEQLENLPQDLPEPEPENRDGYVTVTMRIREETLQKIDDILEVIDDNNRTDVVAGAIEMLHEMVNCTEEGGEVVFNYSYGQRSVFQINR